MRPRHIQPGNGVETWCSVHGNACADTERPRCPAATAHARHVVIARLALFWATNRGGDDDAGNPAEVPGGKVHIVLAVRLPKPPARPYGHLAGVTERACGCVRHLGFVKAAARGLCLCTLAGACTLRRPRQNRPSADPIRSRDTGIDETVTWYTYAPALLETTSGLLESTSR